MKIPLQENIPLSSLTTLKIGGPARWFIEVTTQEDLTGAIKYAKQKNIPYLLIGGGSNLLVSDQGFPGLVIKNQVTGIRAVIPAKAGIQEKTGSRINSQREGVLPGMTIVVQAGTDLNDLVDYTITHGLDGISTMKGIPGTVGGAVYGSAGAYGDNIRDYLVNIRCFDGERIVEIGKDDYQTGYRDSIFKTQLNLIILEVWFSGFPKADPQKLLDESIHILSIRSEKYPPDTLCPGSFFKNVPIDNLSQEVLNKIPQEKIRFNKIPAGFLLEAVGAKGDQIGQIKVAQNHANTFINLGHGSASDFYNLALKHQQAVKDKFGITLEPEVQLINLPPLS